MSARDLRSLLEEACSRPEAEREAWLREACGDDEELFERALRLAGSAAVPEGFLDTPVGADAMGALGMPAVGERLGPWLLEAELGRGGMGAVFRASRDDGAFQRTVAIKVLAGRLAGRELELRFRRECELQASLQHPGIARLLDTGVGSSGEPYLVLEYVDGARLDEWAGGTRTTTERLELFAAICDAVDHAHRRLVVHRDLKPANVLVTRDGQPKLLDFGIAKLVADAESDERNEATWADLTRSEQRLFTPAYASPEQLAGEPVSVASDVYSLGVLLYELLVGRRPFELGDASWAELVRAVGKDRPKAPSALAPKDASATDTAARALVGDLDAIVLCALRKEPERRFASAALFAEDVRRHLAGLPVRARPDTFGYRAASYCRRHTALVATAALFVVALAAGFVSTVHQYLEAEDARELAESRLTEKQALADSLELERASAVERSRELERLAEELEAESERARRRFDDVRRFSTDLVFDVHRSLIDLPGSIGAQERVLAIGADHLASLEAEAEDDAGLALELAGAWLRLGDSQGGPFDANLGRTEDAAASYERALTLASRVLYRTTDEEGARAANRLELVAAARLASVRSRLGAAEDARRLLEGVVGRATDLARRDGATLDELRDASLVVESLLGLRIDADDLGGAADLVDELAAIDEGLLAAGAGAPALEPVRLLRLWRVAEFLDASGDLGGALDTNRLALERARATPGLQPRFVRIGRARLAHSLGRLERADEALALYQRNASELEDATRDDPRDVRARQDLAICSGFLATALEDAGRFDEAQRASSRTVELARALAQEDPANQEKSQLLFVKALEAVRIHARSGAGELAALRVDEALAELARRLETQPGWLELSGATAALATALEELARKGALDAVDWPDLARRTAALLELHARDPRVPQARHAALVASLREPGSE